MSYRELQLKSVIKHDVAQFIVHNFEAISCVLTIIDVDVSSDLLNGIVRFQTFPYSHENSRMAIKFLESNRRTMQNLIGKKHRLKNTPVLLFRQNINHQNLDKISSLYRQINDERS